MFEQTLKEISAFNSTTVDFQNLSLLIFITQSCISDLKNAKSKKINTYEDFVINPTQLLLHLSNFDNENGVGKQF